MKASLLASAEKKFLFESDDGASGCQRADCISRSHGAAGVSGLFPSMNFFYFFTSARWWSAREGPASLKALGTFEEGPSIIHAGKGAAMLK